MGKKRLSAMHGQLDAPMKAPGASARIAAALLPLSDVEILEPDRVRRRRGGTHGNRVLRVGASLRKRQRQQNNEREFVH